MRYARTRHQSWPRCRHSLLDDAPRWAAHSFPVRSEIMCEELEHSVNSYFLFVSESGPVEAPPISMTETVLLVVTALQPLYTATS
jgi:hypothetical protein